MSPRRAQPSLRALALLASLIPTVAARAEDSGGESTTLLLTEQILVLATILGSVAALPTLIDFLVERRKRRERLSLSLDDEPVAGLSIRLAGQEELLEDIADLIDRIKDPRAYRSLTLGNEALIIGPPLSGKKTLARRIAQMGGIERLITVYNPRNTDALARAKTLLRRQTDERVMLLLPNIDEVVRADDEELEAELDALIETTSGRQNVMVVGTASHFEPDSRVDNLFGMKIVLPGTPPVRQPHRPHDPALARVLERVARFYLARARQDQCALEGIDEPAAVARILSVAQNPAEIEDIVEAARTDAVYRRRTGRASAGAITPEVLDKAIRRVMATA